MNGRLDKTMRGATALALAAGLAGAAGFGSSDDVSADPADAASSSKGIPKGIPTRGTAYVAANGSFAGKVEDAAGFGSSDDVGATLARAASSSKKIPTKLTASVTENGDFAGKVKSKTKSCRSKRKVTLYRGPNEAVGTAISNRAGAWSVEVSDTAPSGAAAEYYATVKAKKAGGKRCAADRSPTVSVDGASQPPSSTIPLPGGNTPPPPPPPPPQ